MSSEIGHANEKIINFINVLWGLPPLLMPEVDFINRISALDLTCTGEN